MSWLNAVVALLQALPELISLIQTIQQNLKSASVQTKVAQEVQTIHDAYKTQNAPALNQTFDTKS